MVPTLLPRSLCQTFQGVFFLREESGGPGCRRYGLGAVTSCSLQGGSRALLPSLRQTHSLLQFFPLQCEDEEDSWA